MGWTIAQGRAFTVGCTLLTVSAVVGCDSVRAKLQPYVCDPAAAGSGTQPRAAGATAANMNVAGAAAPVQEPAQALEPDHVDDTPLPTAAGKFALPFAWEKSPTEPLSRARTFLREMQDDNAQHVTKHGAAVRGYAARESPRTTVLTCADSRVQASAFDATPENDDYTVRNLGNQLETSLGAVQYGVESVGTPVLLILGHTGCEAVRAAASDGHVPDAVRRELSAIRVKKVKGRLDDKRLASAVIENVHEQVKSALKRFSGRVTSNDLTIIGAVYDLRNDLGKGVGRVSIVNVNGNRDEARLKAFMDAIMASPNPKGGASSVRENPLERLARALSESATFGDDEEDEEDEGDAP
jgi:carbonic anhydrase